MASPSPTSSSRSSAPTTSTAEVGNGSVTPKKSDTNSTNLNPLSNFLEMFFNAAFFICLCPFRVKRAKNGASSSKPFIISTYWPQRIICAILTLLSLFWYIRELRISYPKYKTPAGYVQLILAAISDSLDLLILEKLWLNRNDFLEIVNYVSGKLTDFRWARKMKLIAAPIAYSFVGLVLFLTIRGVDVHGGIIHDWTWNRWINSLVYAGRYNFFLSDIPFPDSCNNTFRIVLDGEVRNYVQSVDTLLLVLTLLGSFTSQLIGPFRDFLMLMTTLTLWTATRMFCRKVKMGARRQKPQVVEENRRNDDMDKDSLEKSKQEEPDNAGEDAVCIEMSPSAKIISEEWKEIYEEYQYVKKLADLINQSMGLYVSGYIVECVLYYAVFFDLIFAEGYYNWGRILSLLFFLASTCTILILCADLVERMSALKSWLSVEENRKTVPIDLVVLLINQVDSKAVSIKGSKIFPITWHTLVGMVGVTMTYFILCVKDQSLAKQLIKC